MNFEKDLNEKQFEAVTTNYPRVRVVAGAGSGKTRVLTYRIAYLLSEYKVYPWSILAITFTNKVANEMKTRVLKMIPDAEKDLTIKTFHSFAASFLRAEISVLGYPRSFSIIDEEDQTKIIKDIAAEMGFKRGDKIVGKTISYIGRKKLKGLYPEDIRIDKPAFEDERTCLSIYERYEEEKTKALSLDFDDLLLKANYILENYSDIRSKWQKRIDFILIDEFQDTNDVEYKLIKLLMKPSTQLYVVGDPDQTIYTWRGANQNIILNLEKEFIDIKSIILNRNYRSTQNILDSANKLIANNKLRVPKDLYTEEDKGTPVNVRRSPSVKSEADYVAREIKKLVSSDHLSYNDFAILYRSNYITMEFEAAFAAYNIPYKIYGGLKFYQRREIKDVLAYFHLISNIKDNIAFERIMNVPKRGIGESSVTAIKTSAEEAKLSLYEYIRNVPEEEAPVSRKIISSLKAMVLAIDNAREKISSEDEVYVKTLEDLIWSIGYQDYILKEDDGDERLENVKALFSDVRHYLKNFPDSTFDEYLQNIALLSAQDEVIEGDFVTMMTVHTAKGLEFPVVFVVRFNQGVFPNQRATTEGGFEGFEEERRLAYVAMTRAKTKLYLTYSEDYSYVLGGMLSASQFLKESGNEVAIQNDSSTFIPRRSTNTTTSKVYFADGNHLDFTKDEPIKQDFSQVTNDVDGWAVGDICIHKKFGRGVVISVDGDDIITVNFEEHGEKSIMGNHPFVSKGGHEA